MNSYWENEYQDYISFPDFLKSQPIPFKKIPPYLFRMSSIPINEFVPELVHVLKESHRLNPDYIQVYLDDNDCDNFMKHYFPFFLKDYRNVIPGAYRSDIVRLGLLFEYGGVYNDIGHVYQQSLSSIIPKEIDFVLTNERFDSQKGIHNAFMASIPKNPIVYEMLDHIMDNVKHKRYNDSTLDITGPALLTSFRNMFYFDFKQGTQGIIPLQYRNKVYQTLFFILGNNEISYANTTLLKTKFDNYIQVVYKNVLHYDTLWKLKQVYHIH